MNVSSSRSEAVVLCQGEAPGTAFSRCTLDRNTAGEFRPATTPRVQMPQAKKKNKQKTSNLVYQHLLSGRACHQNQPIPVSLKHATDFFDFLKNLKKFNFKKLLENDRFPEAQTQFDIFYFLLSIFSSFPRPTNSLLSLSFN